MIAFGLVTCNQFSAVTAMLSYSAEIVTSTNSGLDPDLVSAVLGCVAITSTIFMDKAGRVPLLITSEIGMSISFILLGVFYYLKEDKKAQGEEIEGAITWLPLVALFTYNLFYNIGVGPLPRVISTEILPQHVKALALTLSLSLNWSLAFAVTKTFTMLTDALKLSGYFWLYAGICAIGMLFVLFFVPETKGKSLAEIENSFKIKKTKNAQIDVIA